MDKIERQTLMRMIQVEGCCVSIYMPTQRFFPDTRQNPIRFRNLLREAEEKLVALNVRPATARDMLKPAGALAENVPFWEYQEDGLACFITEEGFDHYRLPFRFEEFVTVSDQLHIKPLLPLFSGADDFLVLALSLNDVRLLSCSRYDQAEIELQGVPRRIEDVISFDDLQKHLQFHTGTPDRIRGVREAMYHGHGGGSDEAKDRISVFFQRMDRELKPIIGEEDRPLVLAGVEYLLPIFRQASAYPRIMPGGIPGNPEETSLEELRTEGWKIVEPYFLEEKRTAETRYRGLAGTGRTSLAVEEIVPDAYNGRVETLFVALGVQQWGSFDEKTSEAIPHGEHQPGDQDLLDLAAVYTFLKGGVVYAVSPDKVPGNALLAAIFRY